MTSAGPAPARAPRILVIQHSATEGPGTLDAWLPAAGAELHVVHAYAGEPVPADLAPFDALLVLGGPQQAYDDDSGAWLPDTKQLLRKAVEQELPTLGICLGGQLLAEATGGRVALGDAGIEAGARLVAKRDAAWEDELFLDVPFTPTVVQWHEDAIVDLPPGAVLLAGSTMYPHQAFRLGRRAWGVQFHLETDAEMVRHWGASYTTAVVAAGLDPIALAERAVEELPEVEACWRPVMDRFVAIAAGRARVALPLLDS